MKPLNTVERKKPFLYFLLFFFVTALSIFLILFFGSRVPFKQNDALQEQIAKFENERAFTYSFLFKLKEVTKELDSVNRPGVPVDFLESQIDQKLSLLTKAIGNADSSIDKNAYQDVVKTFYNMKDDKKTIRNSSSKDVLVQQYMQDNTTLKQSLKEWQDAYNSLKLQMMASQR